MTDQPKSLSWTITSLRVWPLSTRDIDLCALWHTFTPRRPWTAYEFKWSFLGCYVRILDWSYKKKNHEVMAGERDDVQLHQCALSRHSTIITIKQKCGFECHNDSPDNSVIRVYVQVDKWFQKDNFSVNICDISVASVWVWKLRTSAGDMKIGRNCLSRI